jgi:phosphoribosylglycinamide formyltransferase-1
MQRLDKTQTYKVGFLLSAGGSAFASSVEMSGLPANKFHVISDRNCGALTKVADLGISCEKISSVGRSEMSVKVAEAFSNAGCNVIITNFSRLVGPELFERILTVNIHPSLLPAYPGLDSVADAAKAQSPMQGATLHLIDEGMDTGPILAQTVHATPYSSSLSWRRSLAYRQKVLMILVFLDWLDNNLIDLSCIGLSAFERTVLPDGDTFFSPGFMTLVRTKSVTKWFDDLAVTDF